MLLKELPGDNRAIENVTDYLFEIFSRTEHTDSPAFIVDEMSYTFFDIYQRACRVTNFLEKFGTEGGDKISLAARDGCNFPAILIGALKAGAVPIPINTFLKPADYLYYLNGSPRKTARPAGLRYKGGHHECG